MLVAFAILTVFNISFWFQWATSKQPSNDFQIFYVGAKLALRRGMAAVYDPATLAPALTAIGNAHGVAYASVPPFQFWTVIPLTILPVWPAYAVWTLLTLAAAVMAWRLVAVGTTWERAVQLVAFLGVFPVAFTVVVGQYTFITCLAVAAALRLILAGRQMWGGIVLSALVYKPQTAGVVPLAILGTGRVRTAAAFALTVVLIGASAAVGLGHLGIERYRLTLSAFHTMPYFSRLTLLGGLENPALQLAAGALIIAAAIYSARRLGSRRPEMAIVVGVLASLLATPYLNLEDLSLLIVAGWMIIRVTRRRAIVLPMLVTYAAIEFVNASPLPLLIAEVLWFAWLISGAPGLDQDRSAATEVQCVPLDKARQGGPDR